MASPRVHSTENNPSGYKYEFIDKIPEHLLCQKCKHVAREPNLTSCCGAHFCEKCITPYHRDNQPCPICNEASFKMMLDKRDQKKILTLELYCPMKSRGCEWTGQLEQLEGHMDVQSGDCLYVDIECPSHCDQKVQKRNVQNHLSQECPLREYTCPHCNFKASYKVVSEDHLEVCSYLPVQCPNRCGVTCERQDLKDHMKICNKEELECCFSHTGCQGRFLREDKERHMEENTKKHLSLMATTMLKISKEMEKQEVMFQERFEQQKVEFQERLQEEEVKHREQEVKLQELLQKKLQEYEDKLQEQERKLQEQEMKLQDKAEQQKVEFHERLQKEEVKLQEMLQEQDEKFLDKLQEQETKLQEQETKLQEQETKLQEQGVKFQDDLRGKESKLEKIREELEKKERETEMKLKDIENKVAELQYNTGYVCRFPVTITMPLYEQLKVDNNRWHSQVLYTDSGGYSFRISVYPNGFPNVDGHGTHVSVCHTPEVGNYDARLKWPVTITVTVQLLNQHADNDHVTEEIVHTYEKKNSISTNIGIIEKFISHKELGWNAEKETQYLKNNSLQFKVVEVKVEN